MPSKVIVEETKYKVVAQGENVKILSVGIPGPVGPGGSGGGSVDSVNGQTGDVVLDTSDISESGNQYFTNLRAISSVLTGFSAGAGTVAATDTILQAFQKIVGNIAVLVTGVSSVFGRTGAVTAQNGDYTTEQVTESVNLYYTDERVDDRVAALIQNGTGITWFYNDASGTLTPTVTITQYSDELAQDAVGSMIADTDTVDLTYTDGTPELKADVKKQMSITSDASGLRLSGDSASPGNSKLYGTDGSGVKGWYAQPSGGGFSPWLPDAISGWIVAESDINSGTAPFITIAAASGTGSSAGTAITTGDAITHARCGVARLTPGTTASGKGGRSTISGNGNLGLKTGTEYKFGVSIRSEDAPDATDDFYIFVGLRQSSSADPRSAASAGLYYDRGYTNWQLLDYTGGAATYVDTGIAFAADTWFEMGLHVIGDDTAANVTVEGFIDGASVGTITAVQNVSSLWGFNYEITKLAGTNHRYLYVDYESLKSRRT